MGVLVRGMQYCSGYNKTNKTDGIVGMHIEATHRVYKYNQTLTTHGLA